MAMAWPTECKKKKGGSKPVFLFLLSPIQGKFRYERDSSS